MGWLVVRKWMGLVDLGKRDSRGCEAWKRSMRSCKSSGLAICMWTYLCGGCVSLCRNLIMDGEPERTQIVFAPFIRMDC